MKIELRPLAEIKPYEKNPRLNDSAVDAVAESIRQFGFRQPIVVDGDGCWLWTGATNGQYGTFYVNGAKRYAHRHSYMVHRGPIPSGMMVLHSCDKPLCINPNHLHVGTQSDNMREASDRKRLRVGRRNPRARRSVDEVIAIRRAADSGESYSSIARRMKIALSNVSLIARRKLWRCIYETRNDVA